MNVFYFGADNSWSALLEIGFRRRNTCILKALAENPGVDKVYVVRKSSRSAMFRQIFRKKINNLKVQDIVYADLLPNMLMSTIGLAFINRFFSSWTIQHMARNGHGRTLLWAYWPKGYQSLYESGLKGEIIFDADHNIIDDPNIPESDKPEREKLLIKIGNNAKWILSSTLSMIEWYNKRGFFNTIRLRNGVDLSRFRSTTSIRKKEFFHIVYCGTLSRWIDYDLFSNLAKSHIDWQFTIIGKPYQTEEWRILEGLPNVNLIGEKNADEVARILPGFDVAINLYKRHPALDVDSMKIYEYLAAGLPVVSTFFHDKLNEDFGGLLLLGQDFLSIEGHLLDIDRSREFGNISKSEKFLDSATWQNRVDLFLKNIVQPPL